MAVGAIPAADFSTFTWKAVSRVCIALARWSLEDSSMEPETLISALSSEMPICESLLRMWSWPYPGDFNSGGEEVPGLEGIAPN